MVRLPTVTWTQVGLGVAALVVVGWIGSGFFSGATEDNGQPPQPQRSEITSGERSVGRTEPGGGSAAPASIEAAGAVIEPAETTVGDVTFTLTLTEIRHMYDAAAFGDGATAGTPAQGNQGGAKPPPGSAILNGARKVTHNIDPSQKAPADAKDGKGEMLRHMVLKVQRGSSEELVPYLEVSLDMLRNGRPVLYDQALLPMVSPGEGAASIYYGNNVAFPAKGVYQVFVRLRPNPFLGTEAPPAAQFNITFK